MGLFQSEHLRLYLVPFLLNGVHFVVDSLEFELPGTQELNLLLAVIHVGNVPVKVLDAAEDASDFGVPVYCGNVEVDTSRFLIELVQMVVFHKLLGLFAHKPDLYQVILPGLHG